jgi:hypothetical protein
LTRSALQLEHATHFSQFQPSYSSVLDSALDELLDELSRFSLTLFNINTRAASSSPVHSLIDQKRSPIDDRSRKPLRGARDIPAHP